MKSRSGFVILYILLTVTVITAEHNNFRNVSYVTKPLLALSLIILVAFEKQTLLSVSSKRLFLTALFFALCGDIFLMIRGTDFFIQGLCCFLVMQWLYISIFRKQTSQALLTWNELFRFVPFLVIPAILFILLLSKISDSILLASIAIYMVSIAAMAWLAWMRYGTATRYSFIFVFSGAVLLMISDALIAINRFIIAIPFASVSVLGTYAAAQLLITLGQIKKGQTG